MRKFLMKPRKKISRIFFPLFVSKLQFSRDHVAMSGKLQFPPRGNAQQKNASRQKGKFFKKYEIAPHEKQKDAFQPEKPLSSG